MGYAGGKDCYFHSPDPHEGYRRDQDHQSRGGGEDPDEEVLHGVVVDGHGRDGRRPLVVHLVDCLVEELKQIFDLFIIIFNFP